MANTTLLTTVVGVFHDHDDADRAVAELHRANFTNDQIGLAGHHRTLPDGTEEELPNKAGEGAAIGAAVGAGTGGLIGLGILAGFIPAIGPAIAGGALAALLVNAAGGAAVAGLIGMMVGMGIPEEDAEYYEGEYKAGRTVVTVRAESRLGEAHEIIRRHNGFSRHTQRTMQ